MISSKFLVILLSFAYLSSAQQFRTNISCVTDADCNHGTCGTNSLCRCDELWYIKELQDGSTIPCAQTFGQEQRDNYRALVAISVSSYIFFLFVHVANMLTTSSRTTGQKSRSWQFDSRFTFACLAFTCTVRIIHVLILYAWSFGDVHSYGFVVLGDLGKIGYFETGTAVVLFWYLTVNCQSVGEVDQKLRTPYLIISAAIYLFWWGFGSFGYYFGKGGLKTGAMYFRLAVALIILLFFALGLAVYGRMIISRLSTRGKNTTKFVRKISFTMYMTAIIVVALVVIQVIGLLFNQFAIPKYHYVLQWVLYVLEMMINATLTAVFSGGDYNAIWKVIVWTFAGFFGKQAEGKRAPMEAARRKYNRKLFQHASDKESGSAGSEPSTSRASSTSIEIKVVPTPPMTVSTSTTGGDD